MILVQSVYSQKGHEGGKRFLVTRKWPSSVRRSIPRKEKGGLADSTPSIDGWVRDLAPTEQLEKWFQHAPDKLDEFKKRYLKELQSNRAAWTSVLNDSPVEEDIVLVYGSKTPDPVSSSVLKEFLSAKRAQMGSHPAERRQRVHADSKRVRANPETNYFHFNGKIAKAPKAAQR